MLSILLDQLLKGNPIRNSVVRWAFFGFNGILAAILMNDILRVLYGDFDNKLNLQYGIAGSVAVSPFLIEQFTLLGNKTNNMAMGGGMMIGTYWANRTEHGQRIDPVPM